MNLRPVSRDRMVSNCPKWDWSQWTEKLKRLCVQSSNYKLISAMRLSSQKPFHIFINVFNWSCRNELKKNPIWSDRQKRLMIRTSSTKYESDLSPYVWAVLVGEIESLQFIKRFISYSFKSRLKHKFIKSFFFLNETIKTEWNQITP